MKPNETKTESTRDMISMMNAAGRELKSAIGEFRALSLAAVNMMLAGGELWDTDFEEMLKEKKSWLDGCFVESGIEDINSGDKDEDNRHTLACMRLSDIVSDWSVECIEMLGNILEKGGPELAGKLIGFNMPVTA